MDVCVCQGWRCSSKNRGPWRLEARGLAGWWSRVCPWPKRWETRRLVNKTIHHSNELHVTITWSAWLLSSVCRDEEMDGEWEAPQIPNPACETAPGCGEWKRPRINNPQYKGKWKAPLVDNPNYQVTITRLKTCYKIPTSQLPHTITTT